MANSQQINFPAAPIFGVIGDRDATKSSQLYIDDIFDEFLFSNDKQQNYFGDEKNRLDKYGDLDDDDIDSDNEDTVDSGDKKRKRSRGLQKNMSEEQKVERRSVCDTITECFEIKCVTLESAIVNMQNDREYGRNFCSNPYSKVSTPYKTKTIN